MEGIEKIKGYEIMEMIARGELKEGSKFKMFSKDFQPVVIYRDKSLWLKGDFGFESVTDNINDYDFATADFLVIPEEINIQNIKPLDEKNSDTMNEVAIIKKVNEVVEGLKQLDRRK